VPDHGHSIKNVYLPTVHPFFLTLSLSPRRRRPRRAATPRSAAPRCPSRPAAPAPRPSPGRAPPTAPAPLAVAPRRPPRRAPHRPPPRPRPPAAAPRPQCFARRALHAGKVHAADLQPPRPVVSPATHRLARDQTSKVIYMK
jgi:hypothetical protein